MKKNKKKWKEIISCFVGGSDAVSGVHTVYDDGLESLEILRLSELEGNRVTVVVYPVLKDAEFGIMLMDSWGSTLGLTRDNLLFPESEIGGKIIAEAEVSRLRVLNRIVNEGGFTIVASACGIVSRVQEYDKFVSSTLKIEVGSRFDFRELSERLIEFDYGDEYDVLEPGDFARRGGIFDIFSPAHDFPVRIEFFDDMVETLRIFNPETQRTTGKCESYTVVSRSEFKNDSGPEVYLFDYLKEKDFEIIIVHPEECGEHISNFCTERAFHAWSDFMESHRNEIKFIVSPSESFAFLEKLSEFHSGVRKVSGLIFGECSSDEMSDELFAQWHRQLTLDRIKQWIETSYTIILTGVHNETVGYLKEWLKSGGIKLKDIVFSEDEIPYGICFIAEKVVFLTEKEVFSSVKHHNQSSLIIERSSLFDVSFDGNDNENREEDIFFMLDQGDYAVHINHGICIYHGIEDMREGEMFKLEFEDEIILYVPVRNANLLSRFIGSKKDLPKLHKIGSSRWTRDKVNAARDIKMMAGELLQVQAARLGCEGFAFPKDDMWQHIFEESFTFSPTIDQIIASKEIKKDMTSPSPMDRLLCGDVGFGKTEVAMRAAFKAVSAGKQVAVLVPTTILAQQHYYSFRDRFAEHPFFIEMLSRFRTRLEQREIIKKLSDGMVDILIGTHRILQSDIVFKDLGLVIIDEEQRFGVSHKEKLKKLRTTVDILTMTATPIPRTMYMSMTGLRNLSTLASAPGKRLPVRTFVAKYDENVVKDAIMNEIGRGGQVYYLHNRVNTIHHTMEILRDMMPHVRFAVAHGRMDEKELEKVMGRFLDGKVDVLVCTTIIESGLDIQNSNTIIIERADRFGLSELYQLRGRVGRWHRQAYAYLLMPPDSILTGNARKRISAIKKFSELGAGFRLAMRDLEIRGAGNILGSRQSGHINAIGFELYCNLLRSAVNEQRHGEPLILSQVDIDIDFLKFSQGSTKGYVYACIPKDYIPSERVRTGFYKKLAKISRGSDIVDLESELTDRFGELPESVKNFIEYSKIRMTLSLSGIEFLRVSEGKVFLKKNNSYIKVDGRIPVLKRNAPESRYRELLSLIKKILIP